MAISMQATVLAALVILVQFFAAKRLPPHWNYA